jgi:glycosyltransferase involved in cell wall biosynthesis
MAAGRPVISIKIGQDKPLALSEETGFRVDADSSDQAVDNMARAMVSFAENPNLRDRMGKAARDVVASNYLWDRSSNALCRCYKECFSQHDVSNTSLQWRNYEKLSIENPPCEEKVIAS